MAEASVTATAQLTAVSVGTVTSLSRVRDCGSQCTLDDCDACALVCHMEGKTEGQLSLVTGSVNAGSDQTVSKNYLLT